MNGNQKDDAARKRSKAGFTLVEIMLVVVILGILVSVGMVATRGRSKTASIAATRTTIRAMSVALNSFEVDNGVYPNSLQELLTDTGHASWNGPYYKGNLTDAWGNQINYSQDNSGYKLTSQGPPGGEPLTN